jgi:hypothetical protein
MSVGSKDMLGLSASHFMKGGRRRKSKVYRGGTLPDAISAAGAGAGNALSALFKPASATPPVTAGGGKRSMSLQRGKSRGRSMRRARSMQASRAGGKKTHRRRKHRSRKHKGGVILQ